MTRRRRDPAAAAAPAGATAPASPPAAVAAGEAARLELPPSGLAAEILANLGGPTATGDRSPGGRERVYSFADALERRGREADLPPQEKPESWVVFALAGERYGLPVAAVQEILRPGLITRVPDSPAPVRGITNLRGRVLAVVDLRVRLGLPSAAVDAHSRILVVDSRQRVLGLLVDAALQVCKLLPSALAPPPPDVMTVRSDYLRGVVHLDEQLIIALDLDRVLLIQDEDPAPGAPAEPVEGEAR